MTHIAIAKMLSKMHRIDSNHNTSRNIPDGLLTKVYVLGDKSATGYSIAGDHLTHI